MKKELSLLKNIEHLVKQLNCREYLHHFGPKKYKLKHHLLALISMEAFQLSLRRVEKLFLMVGISVPTYSALCKSRKKIPTVLFEKLVELTNTSRTAIIETLIGTGMSPLFRYFETEWKKMLEDKKASKDKVQKIKKALDDLKNIESTLWDSSKIV